MISSIEDKKTAEPIRNPAARTATYRDELWFKILRHGDDGTIAVVGQISVAQRKTHIQAIHSGTQAGAIVLVVFARQA